MRLILAVIIASIILNACDRHKCNAAIVTQNGIGCSFWGIKVGTQTYPADSIPDNFKTEGNVVCISYELYSDMRMCPCCGGTWAKIKSIRYPDE